jgi:hypothetical protein
LTAVVFVGPSFAAAGCAVATEFMLQPPAGQGDVYRAVEALRPRAIGIVDGYFEGVPSVWHKEVLWAIAKGVAVYGSASIGALRAAELHAWGMVGVGEIFEAYRDGILEADDEVALLHGPEETGFLALTEPLVNVRWTCRAAEAAGVITTCEATAIVAAAQSIFYKTRTWREIFAKAREAGVPEDTIAMFETWLPQGRVDQKSRDALAMIERMRADLGTPAVKGSATDFEPTFLWERAVAGWTPRASSGGPPARNRHAHRETLMRFEPVRRQ